MEPVGDNTPSWVRREYVTIDSEGRRAVATQDDLDVLVATGVLSARDARRIKVVREYPPYPAEIQKALGVRHGLRSRSPR
jgi:hypothetical protein